MNHQFLSNAQSFHLNTFDIETLKIQSKCLQDNLLNDSPTRFNLILKPKNYSESKQYKLMIVLAGFTSNGTKYFAHKPFEKNYPQTIDTWCEQNAIDDCICVFIDAFTFWGGSQFINSSLVGRYEDYIVKEVCPAVCEQYSVSQDLNDICITGGSSGGYGALHLGSKYPKLFGKVAAIAPDCDFNLSLLPEIYHALPLIKKWGGLDKIKKEIEEGVFFRRRDSHTVINVIAMAHCYSSAKNGLPQFPFDIETGEILKDEWSQWLKHDPLQFIKQRQENIEELKSIYLEVGKYDQFNLQYGARKLNKQLSKYNVKFEYHEFDGNHFDISKKRVNVWNWFLKSVDNKLK